MARPPGRLTTALLLLVATASTAMADPFDWLAADVRMIEATSRSAGRLTFRVGTVPGQGSRQDVAIDVTWNGQKGNESTELLREMTDTPPWIGFANEQFVVRWTAYPTGTSKPRNITRCWHIQAKPVALQPGKCTVPASAGGPGQAGR